MTDYSLTCAMRMYNTITNPLEAAIIPLAPLACFPGGETSGTAAKNIGTLGLAADGSITGVTLNQIDGPGGTRAGLYDGTNDSVDIDTTALEAAFTGQSFTALAYAKVYGVGVWTDGAYRTILIAEVDSNNYFAFRKNNNANTLYAIYKAGGTVDFIDAGSISSVSWMLIAITVSKAADEFKLYLNNAQIGTTQSTLGTWAGATFSKALIGAAPTLPWYGYLSHAAIFSTVLTLANIQAINTAGQAAAWTTITVQRKITAVQGSLALSGQDAGLAAARQFALAYGAFAFTGQDAGVLAGWLLALAVGAFALTGNAATLTPYYIRLGSVTGSDAAIYAVAGSDASQA